MKPSDYPEFPFIGMEHIEPHSMKLLGTVAAGTMKSSAVYFKPGDVLYGRLRPYLNKVYQPTFEGLCSAEFIVLPENDRVEGAYLKYFLNSAAFVRYTSHLNAGDRPRVDFDQLAPYEIPVPGKDKQRRIVAEIEKQFSRLDEAVANLKRVKANLKRYKAAVLKAAVEGRLVSTEAELARREGRSYETGAQLLQRILAARRNQWNGKGKYKEPSAPATTDLPKLPEGWVWSTFEFVADRVTVGHVGPMKDEYVQRGVPFLRSQNVRANRFDPGGLKYVSEAFHDQLGKSALRPGDIVVVRSGSVGVSCVIPDYLSEANCSDLVIVKGPRGVLPAFGAYYMNSVVETRVAAGKVGVALTHFNTQSVAELPLPIPPMAEQDRIVVDVDRRLSFVREVEAEVDANLKRARGLRQASLQTAFFGQSGQQTKDGEGKSTPSRG